MFSDILQELSGRGMERPARVSLIGGTVTWLFARWRVFRAAAERPVPATPATRSSSTCTWSSGPPARTGAAGVLRIRIRRGRPNSTGWSPTATWPRSCSTGRSRSPPRDTLISMEGAEGSYLLETLTNFVCDRVANWPVRPRPVRDGPVLRAGRLGRAPADHHPARSRWRPRPVRELAGLPGRPGRARVGRDPRPDPDGTGQAVPVRAGADRRPRGGRASGRSTSRPCTSSTWPSTSGRPRSRSSRVPGPVRAGAQRR